MLGNEFDSRAADLLSQCCCRGASFFTPFGKEEYQSKSFAVGSCPTFSFQWARAVAEIDAACRELVLRTTSQHVRSTKLRCSVAQKRDRAFPGARQRKHGASIDGCRPDGHRARHSMACERRLVRRRPKVATLTPRDDCDGRTAMSPSCRFAVGRAFFSGERGAGSEELRVGS